MKILLTVAEMSQLIQLARVQKTTNSLADELAGIEVEADVPESQAVKLLKIMQSIPLSGNIDQLQKRLPLFIGLKAKLMEASPSLEKEASVNEESES
jgi:hypothetical protein